MRDQTSEKGSLCEINTKRTKREKTNKCAFYKHKGNFEWQGIKNEPYKTKGNEWVNIIRRVLIGTHGESVKFHVRYFEIFPEGNSSFEKHKHEHVVICVKGEGIVRTGRSERQMGFMDTVYISPNIPHKFLNPFKEPFGFICIVNAKRDRPKLLKK